jgi:ElaB/YqjD/DUF883 family membrane-anchored ribosome-binding protein
MGKDSNSPKSLSEAIEKLENMGNSAARDFKGILEKDYSEIKKSLETLKPYLSDLQETLETEVHKKKNQAEKKVKENPWLAIGIVGIFALIIGIFLGTSTKNNSQDED